MPTLTKAEFAERSERIRQVPQRSRRELVTYQNVLLSRMLQHAYDYVPYYRDLFDRHGVQPRAVAGISDLARVPITTRRRYQAQALEGLLPRGLDPKQLLVERTSGATGVPMTTRQTSAERHLYLQLRSRTFKLLSPELGGRFTYLGATRGPNDPASAFTQVDCRQPLERVIAEVVAAKPDTLIGFPGALAELAARAPAEALRRIRPRLTVASGEVLTPAVRSLLAESFAAPVTQTYASSEFFWMAGECAVTGALHVVDDGLVLEVVDDDGNPLPPGARGNVVATALHSFAQPLIRYAIGDLAVQGRAPLGGDHGCACGAPFSTLAEIQGRELDYLVLPDGSRVHAFTFTLPLREGAKFMQQYQVVQERADFIRVLMVCSRPAEPAELSALRSELEAVLAGVTVELELVSSIEREPSGKFRVVVSRLPSATQAAD